MGYKNSVSMQRNVVKQNDQPTAVTNSCYWSNYYIESVLSELLISKEQGPKELLFLEHKLLLLGSSALDSLTPMMLVILFSFQ